MSELPVTEDNEKANSNTNLNQNKIEERKNEIAGILISAWGFLSIFALFTNKTGYIGEVISRSFFYITGNGAYIIPFLLILGGISLIKFKIIKFNPRLIGFLLAYLTILAIIHTYLFPELSMRYGFLGKGGGIIGGSISWFFIKFFGEVGTYIILGAFLLIALLLWSNILLKTILTKIENTLKSIFNLIINSFKNFKKDNVSNEEKTETLQKDESANKSKVEKTDENDYDFYNIVSEDNIEDVENEEKSKNSNNLAQQNSKTNKKQNTNENKESTYHLPPIDLLSKSTNKKVKLNNKTELLENTLKSFGVDAQVIDVNHGPTITRYEVQPASGVKVSKIVNLANDIALSLAAPDVRIEAPIPGKAAVGIEVPHSGNIKVRIRDIISTKKFQNADSKLTMALGKGIDGDAIITNLSKMPHLLIAGATGSGKSVCINTLITSLLYKSTPEELKLILVDPKKVELSTYKGLPHLFTPVVTDPKKASNVLKLVVNEMEKRYELFSESGTRGIESYNKNVDEEDQIPYIVVIIDELSDLMMVAANEVEDNICRLAQMSRAAGIHLIIATQRPSVDVITGLIKANIPSRISFAVSSQTDSRTILDMGGAEKLLGKGDMLFAPVDASKPKRIQGAFMSDEEINRIVDYAKNQSETEYEIETDDIQEVEISLDENKDELYEEAVKLVVNYRASISMLQRRLHIGHSRAARMIDTMEEEGIVGPYAGSKPREVLIDEDELEKYLNGNEISDEEYYEENNKEKDEKNSTNKNTKNKKSND
ncbi:MAG: DNA translocase FtsK 4TM domain-containing protein [Bacillota bacterium]